VFWPWVQVVRAYVQLQAGDPGELRRELGAGAADIAQLVPAVREHLPDLPAPPPVEPEAARFRLFDSLTGFLGHPRLPVPAAYGPPRPHPPRSRPRRRAHTPTGATARPPAGPHPRELEVLALVADGRTNHQIAETLYISDKTASVHVSHILAKLGVRNRSEAGAVAHRLRLTAR
jgi:DNA-binding CsgD family transcriptional regulator